MIKGVVFLGIMAMILGMVGISEAYYTNPPATVNFTLGTITWDNPYDDPIATKYPYDVYTFNDDLTAEHLMQSTAVGASTPLLYLFQDSPSFNQTNPDTFLDWLTYAAGTGGINYTLTAGTTYHLVVTETGTRRWEWRFND